MGSGEKAEKESNRIIGLLEQLLSTGFNRQSAIRLIHSVVLSGSEPHTYSTLDLATLDLFNGKRYLSVVFTANRSCNMRYVFCAMCMKSVECSVGGGLKWRGLTEYVILKIQSIRTL